MLYPQHWKNLSPNSPYGSVIFPSFVLNVDKIKKWKENQGSSPQAVDCQRLWQEWHYFTLQIQFLGFRLLWIFQNLYKTSMKWRFSPISSRFSFILWISIQTNRPTKLPFGYVPNEHSVLHRMWWQTATIVLPTDSINRDFPTNK